MYKRTYQTHPQLWDDALSVLAKISYKNSSTQKILASGWHLRQIRFEYPNVDFNDNHKMKVAEKYIFPADSAPDTQDWQVDRFEIEISLDNDYLEQAEDFLSKYVPADIAHTMVDSASHFNERAAVDNRGTKTTARLPHVDLLNVNLPVKTGSEGEQLHCHTRWCRVFYFEQGTVTLYQNLTNENKQALRWPHYCIWLDRGESYFNELSDLIGDFDSAVEIPVKYVEYNLSNWRIEFDFWQDLPFQITNSNTLDEATDKLNIAQREVSVLSTFITQSLLALQNLERNVLDNGELKDKERIERRVESIRSTVIAYRDSLMRASTLLANTAQFVQTMINEENAKVARSTNKLITYGTAIFLIPTLIISFYSMTIIGIHDTKNIPTTGEVALFAVGAALVSLAVLLSYRFFVMRSNKANKKAK